MTVWRLRRFVWGGDVAHGVASATQRWSARRGVVVVLEDSAGRLGFGEASPLPGFGAERLQDALQALGSIDLAAVGSIIESESRAHHQPEANPQRERSVWLARAADAALGALGARSPSARFALETALVDLAAQARGCSIASWLREDAAASVLRTVLLGALDPSSFEAADAALVRGARSLKLKGVGTIPSEEARVIHELRRRIGPVVELRIDFNGALELDATPEIARQYAEAGASMFEEPVAGARIEELGTLALPWLADESLVDRACATRLLQGKVCAGVVLKPTLLGGFAACLALGDAARAAGLRVVVTHAFEGPIALAAAAELALALRADFAGLDAHAALAAFPAIECPQLPEAGVPLAVLEAPGRLGLGLDDDARRLLLSELETFEEDTS